MKKFGEMGFREKWGKCGKLGRLVADGGWKWPVVVRWVVGCDGWRWCVVGLDFRECLEVENGEGEGEGCTAATGK
jgi:hypothetical protein